MYSFYSLLFYLPFHQHTELTVQFSQNVFTGSEFSGIVPVTILLRGGTADRDISVTVTPSDQSPLSAEGKRCVS